MLLHAVEKSSESLLDSERVNKNNNRLRPAATARVLCAQCIGCRASTVYFRAYNRHYQAASTRLSCFTPSLAPTSW